MTFSPEKPELSEAHVSTQKGIKTAEAAAQDILLGRNMKPVLRGRAERDLCP